MHQEALNSLVNKVRSDATFHAALLANPEDALNRFSIEHKEAEISFQPISREELLHAMPGGEECKTTVEHCGKSCKPSCDHTCSGGSCDVTCTKKSCKHTAS